MGLIIGVSLRNLYTEATNVNSLLCFFFNLLSSLSSLEFVILYYIPLFLIINDKSGAGSDEEM
jgi:hypothetical protein